MEGHHHHHRRRGEEGYFEEGEFPQDQGFGGGFPQDQGIGIGGGFPQDQGFGGGFQQNQGFGDGYQQNQGIGGGYQQNQGFGGGGFPGEFSQQGSYGQPGMGGMSGQFNQQRREFFIMSEMNGKVVDIDRGNTGEGTKICTWDKHPDPSKNQLWYLDNQGFIRSALNDMAFSNRGNDHALKMEPAGNDDPRSQWRLEGNRIVNLSGDVLDIKGRKDHNGAEIISYKDEGHPNQMWRFEYVM